MSVRKPQYGVELNEDQLTTSDPCAVLYGVTPDDKFIPLKIDSSGRIQLGSGVTLNTDELELGDVGITAIDTTSNLPTELTGTIVGGHEALNVNVIGSIVASSPTVIDSGAIVPGQLTNFDTELLYGYNGANWERIFSSSNRLVVDGSQVIQPVSGTGNFTVVQSSGLNLHVNVDNFPATVAVTQSTSPWIVSGTVTSNIGTTNGLALDSTLSGIKSQTDQLTFTTGSLNVNVTNTPLAVTQSGTWNLNNITGTISLPTGAATEATLSALNAKLNTLGQKTMANSTPVVIASDQSAIPISGTITSIPTTSTVATTSQVSRSNTNQTLLASNANRKGATFYNDASANLFLKLGAVATSTDYTIRLQNNDYYEVPFNYTGRIDGIWASNGAGDVTITELT